MATDKKGPRAKKLGAKKSEAKKPSAKKAAATAARASARKTAAAAPVPTPKTEPVRVNALKPDERLAEVALLGPFEKSFKAAVPAAVAFNNKLVDIAQTNMNAGMALVRDLAGAKSPWEMMLLGMTHWHDNMGLLTAQTRELRTLSSTFMASANEPIRAHLRGV